MAFLRTMRATIRDALELRAIAKHRSLIGRRAAGTYTDFWDRCRREFDRPAQHGSTEIVQAVETFRSKGVTSFQDEATIAVAEAVLQRLNSECSEEYWDPEQSVSGSHNFRGDLWNEFPELHRLFIGGPIASFLENYFQSHFKIFYGTLYRTVATNTPSGSQLWHSDSGPGICVNIMYYLHPCHAENGALQAVSWPTALELHRMAKRDLRQALIDLGPNAPKVVSRDLYARYFADKLSGVYSKEVQQPVSSKAGLVVPFLNNTLHKGGFPASGFTRTAIVFHCYPSLRPMDPEVYRMRGIAKGAPYPLDPDRELS